MTHFAVAESERPDDKAFTEEQIRRFEVCREQTLQAGIHPRFLHMANSSATMAWEKARFNLVRPGLMLYGVAPRQLSGQARPEADPSLENRDSGPEADSRRRFGFVRQDVRLSQRLLDCDPALGIC